MAIKLGIVDDHQLVVGSLKLLLEAGNGFEVTLVAYSGKELQKKISAKGAVLPEIILVDVNMQEMDGVETASWINEKFPSIKLVALSMQKDDNTIMKMLKAGCCAYLFKNINHDEFERALLEVHNKGYYNGDECNINLRKLLVKGAGEETITLTKNELAFLKLACSDLTYEQIADKMTCSKRTVDSYRETLFRKFSVASRVGMCLEAVRLEYVDYKKSK